MRYYRRFGWGLIRFTRFLISIRIRRSILLEIRPYIPVCTTCDVRRSQCMLLFPFFLSFSNKIREVVAERKRNSCRYATCMQENEASSKSIDRAREIDLKLLCRVLNICKK